MTKLTASSLMEKISKHSPLALLALALLSFFAIGVFSVDYYQSLLESRFGRQAQLMAILIATIQEAVRFGLVVTSIRDFKNGKNLNGSIGLIGSICLVFHDISLSHSIAEMWAKDSVPYSNLFLFLILIGLLLEFRLILTIGGESIEKAKAKKSQAVSTITYSKNGASTAANN